MISMKTMQLHGEYFIAVTIRLPHNEIRLITCTHGILCTAQFSVSFTQEHRSQCVMAIVEQGDSFEELLESQIISCTAAAAAKGITVGMSGEEALFGMFS